MITWPRWRKATWWLKDVLERGQQAVEQISIVAGDGEEPGRCVVWGTKTKLEHAAPLAPASHAKSIEVPQDWSKGLKPCDPKNNIVAVQRNGQTINGEGLSVDEDGDVASLTMAGNSITIGHHHLRPGGILEMEAGSTRYCGANEIE